MNIHRNESSLSFKHATIALILVVPLLLLIEATIREVTSVRAHLQKDSRRIAGQRLTPRGTGERLDQPPVITVSEADVYSFPSGEAVLSNSFQALLRNTIIPHLAKLSARYRCDIIEVIGHTDEQPVHSASNLDGALLRALNREPQALRPGSNVDLGFLRAWAVIAAIRDDPRLAGKTFYAYSAGQTILPGGPVAKPEDTPRRDASRRRIEIRIRRSKV